MSIIQGSKAACAVEPAPQRGARDESYGYDPGSRLLQMTYPTGLKRSPTAAEEMVAWWAGYFPFGELRGLTLANGLNMWSNRDWEYRMDGLFLARPRAGPRSSSATTASATGLTSSS